MLDQKGEVKGLVEVLALVQELVVLEVQVVEEVDEESCWFRTML